MMDTIAIVAGLLLILAATGLACWVVWVVLSR